MEGVATGAECPRHPSFEAANSMRANKNLEVQTNALRGFCVEGEAWRHEGIQVRPMLRPVGREGQFASTLENLYWVEVTSPLPRVTKRAKSRMLIVTAMKRTEPSEKAKLAPPGWKA